MRKILTFLWCLIALSVCGAEGQKIASLSPALTELICYLGGSAQLVARSTACNYPETVKALPAAGDFAIPSLETLAALQVDTVVADTLVDPKVKESIEALKIKFILLPLTSLADYKQAVLTLGAELDKTAVAEAEVAKLEKFMLENPVPENPVPVLVVIWNNPLMSCGKKSFINEFLSLAGGKNIFAAENTAFFSCSLEAVLMAEPEKIIYPCHDGKALDLSILNPYVSIPAIKNQQIYGIKDADLLCRISPRWPQSVALLKQIILGETANVDGLSHP